MKLTKCRALELWRECERKMEEWDDRDQYMVLASVGDDESRDEEIAAAALLRAMADAIEGGDQP